MTHGMKRRTGAELGAAAALLGACGLACAAPEVRVTKDNTVIDRSCVVVIPEGTIIEDADGNGVLHIRGEGITVEFAEGSVLRGRAQERIEEEGWDRLEGVGIRIEGGESGGGGGVTLKNAVVRGYRVGLHASGTDGLTLEGLDVADVYRKRLGSTPAREDSSDWMSPHRNDNNEYLERYAAAVYIEDAEDVTVRGARVRRGQHGIVLDRVNGSRVYDCDASFLTGWGLALWRSSDNLISRNAFDFCVRGHSEGTYNRGQDSAGILFFEQCNRNVIVENSATHGGDSFFGFGGLDALGEGEYARREQDRTRLGCNDNIFLRNDLSYAPAHGWEMTFSFGNILAQNRLEENAICGVWGGFSQETVILDNLFAGNGGMAYGLERGGVNIEHGAGNVIARNEFVDNRVAVHLWQDNPGAIPGLGWGRANYAAIAEGRGEPTVVTENVVVVTNEPRPFWAGGGRRASADEPRLALQVRCEDAGQIAPVAWYENRVTAGDGAGELMRIECPSALVEDPGAAVRRAAQRRIEEAERRVAEVEAIGETRPVVLRDGVPYSAREHLRGREKIVMDEWGPWDHEGVLVRTYDRGGTVHRFEVFGAPRVSARGPSEGVEVSVERGQTLGGMPRHMVEVRAGGDGVRPYEVELRIGDERRLLTGTLVGLEWEAAFWAWTVDPLRDAEGWRAEGERAFAESSVRLDHLNLPYGFGGPNTVNTLDREVRRQAAEAGIGADRFGMLARTTVRLEPGRYRIRTSSDDGVRVIVNGKTIIERWNIHGPTPDEGTFRAGEEPVEIRVEHFENDGYAHLDLSIEPAE